MNIIWMSHRQTNWRGRRELSIISRTENNSKKSEWFPGLRLQQFECLFTRLIVCTSQKNHISVVGLLTICLGRNHYKNEIIPLKMKNESCVRCKSSDCALLFHYWSFDNDLPVLIFCISIIIFFVVGFALMPIFPFMKRLNEIKLVIKNYQGPFRGLQKNISTPLRLMNRKAKRVQQELVSGRKFFVVIKFRRNLFRRVHSNASGKS